MTSVCRRWWEVDVNDVCAALTSSCLRWPDLLPSMLSPPQHWWRHLPPCTELSTIAHRFATACTIYCWPSNPWFDKTVGLQSALFDMTSVLSVTVQCPSPTNTADWTSHQYDYWWASSRQKCCVLEIMRLSHLQLSLRHVVHLRHYSWSQSFLCLNAIAVWTLHEFSDQKVDAIHDAISCADSATFTDISVNDDLSRFVTVTADDVAWVMECLPANNVQLIYYQHGFKLCAAELSSFLSHLLVALSSKVCPSITQICLCHAAFKKTGFGPSRCTVVPTAVEYIYLSCQKCCSNLPPNVCSLIWRQAVWCRHFSQPIERLLFCR